MKKASYNQVFRSLNKTLKNVNPNEVDFIVGISRGGLLPAMHVSTKLVKPLVAAYIDKKDNVYFDRDEWVKGKEVLLVDDIVRSGKTLLKIKNLLLSKGVKGVNTLSIYCLTKSLVKPNYSELSIPDIFFPWDEGKNKKEN
ncbi:MAG: phosphoribosyltransferase [Nitrospiria bacterium]